MSYKKTYKQLRKLMNEHREKVLELIAGNEEVLKDDRDARELMSTLMGEVDRINTRVTLIDYELDRFTKKEK